ncbi:hypothetical protein NIES2111_17300 [Nostoc sp. NIES-2111]|nr:hypothetical protein NIES2111_17300 [Nostoc sp. NIES-2111]
MEEFKPKLACIIVSKAKYINLNNYLLIIKSSNKQNFSSKTILIKQHGVFITNEIRDTIYHSDHRFRNLFSCKGKR